jgi:hypothetical protein
MPSMLPLRYAREKLVISDRSFDTEQVATIGEAFDKACKEMRDKGQPASLQESIAKRLVEIAARGERDPDKMCEYALFSLGLAANVFTVRGPQISSLRTRSETTSEVSV